MTVPDRSLKLLADRGIKVSENEWFGIKLHDGMYEEANKAYYISYDVNSRLRTNLPYVLHQADQLAARVEYEMWYNKSTAQPTPKKKSAGVLAESLNTEQATELKNIFDDLFK
jgi:hypothetical protein